MSGPQGQDPNQAWSPSGQPSGSEEPSTWQPPAYPQSEQPAPTEQYPSAEQPAPTEQYPSAGQYAPTEQYPTGEPYPGTAPQPQTYPGTAPQPEAYPGTQYPYGQPGGYEQPANPYTPPGAQFGEPPTTADGEGQKGSKRSAAILVAVGLLLAAVVAAVAVVGFWKPGYFMTTKLDVAKAQQGVQNILTDQVNGYGVKDVKDVKCNKGENPTVKKGETFNCDATVDGQHKQVTVTFQDDSGTYEVGRPKGA
jgi:hypothetical protein